MTIELYDLCGAQNVRFSPYCWRTRMALLHKGLAYDDIPTAFTEIPTLLDGSIKTLPFIKDGGQIVRGSFEIAEYLEQTYLDRPSLFANAQGLALAKFMQEWAASLHKDIVTMVVKDIHDKLSERDKVYFRQSRESVLGASLEEVQSQRETGRDRFIDRFAPLEALLTAQNFIGGSAPLYADYVVFGTLKWPKAISDFDVLPRINTGVGAWFKRCEDLFVNGAR